ncbi:hypothetical protein G5C01_08410 [Moraxella bovoculi]|uniref:hypothetical protein n=1 Tax=Moraxella bovoculi TaxID=386891 RepID=UPI00156ED515|nr:hypothetical protein [Moraxella bovoculi]NSM11367.1 hypothetical protein [Moraxella bovoculi]
MKIKYLKPAPNATTGDIKDINTAQAKILIQLGFAEVYGENNSDNGNAGDLFGQLDDNQSTDQELSKADETAGKATDNNGEQVQEVAENTLTEPADLAETTKPKKTKTKKTDTENN